MTEITNYWPLKKTAQVNIVRQHNGGYDPRSQKGYEHGPMTIDAAEKQGLLSTSQGTMTFEMTVALGEEHEGARVEKRNGKWVAVTIDDFWNGND